MKNFKKFVSQFLNIYPNSLKYFLKKTPVVIKPKRFANGEQIDGSYDIETGEIILWDPDLDDLEGLLLTLSHELGHKIYHEWLSRYDVEQWLIIRSFERIDFDLNKTYSSLKQPEEEFCTLFSLISLAKYWSRKGMKTKSKKLSLKLNSSFPTAIKSIERNIKKISKPDCHITHKEVKKLKAWVHKVVES